MRLRNHKYMTNLVSFAPTKPWHDGIMHVFTINDLSERENTDALETIDWYTTENIVFWGNKDSKSVTRN